MSSRNVDLVRSVFPPKADLVAAVRDPRPISAFLQRTDVIDPGLGVTFASSQSGGPGIAYEGLEGLIEGWQDWLMPWASYVIEAEDFVEAGDKVVMLAAVTARTSRDGVEITHRPAAVWTVEDDRLTAVTFFLERDQAYEFAGIPAG
jgi:hypothetical protein